jgi:hypothetical protein
VGPDGISAEGNRASETLDQLSDLFGGLWQGCRASPDLSVELGVDGAEALRVLDDL